MAGIDIFIRAKDQASAAINKVKSSLGSLNDETKSMGTLGENTNDDLGLSFDALAGKIAIATSIATTAVIAFKKAIEFSQEGAAIERLMTSGDALAKSLGANMDEIVDKVSAASMGTVSDLDIIASANKALLLGVSADADQLAGLMETAIVRGRAMGMTAQEAFEQIVTGIGRQSAKILDNLGIVIDTKEVYDDYAESLGKTAEELTEVEERQALVNATLKDTQDFIEETGGVVLDSAGKWEALDAAQKNFWNSLKARAADTMSWWPTFWTDFYNSIGDGTERLTLYEQAMAALPENVAPEWQLLKMLTNGMNEEVDMLSQHVLDMNAQFGQGVWTGSITKNVIDFYVALENTKTAAAGAGEGVSKAMGASEASTKVALSALQTLSAEYEKQRGILENDLAKAYENLGKAATDFKNGVAGDLVQGLKDAGLEGDDMLERLQLIDEFAGTQYAVDFMMEMEMPELLERLLNDPDSFLTEAEKFKDYFLPLQNSYQVAAEKIDALQRQLKGLERTYTAQVQVIYSQIGVPPQGLGGGTAGGGGGGKNPNMKAAGGIVHAAAGAFGKQAYYVGEIGPEIFVPSQDGRILSNHESKAAIRSGLGAMNEQPIVININTPINLADRVWVENELAPYIRKGVQDVMARG